MSLSFEEVLAQLNKFARQRKAIEASLLSEPAKARLLAQHDAAVQLFTASVEAEAKAGDGGGTPQVPSAPAAATSDSDVAAAAGAKGPKKLG